MRRLLVVEVLNEAGDFRPLDEIEHEVIMLAMSICKSTSMVARRLGIGRSTLYRKMAIYASATVGQQPYDDGDETGSSRDNEDTAGKVDDGGDSEPPQGCAER